ncbi:hybrid sensor histidine kinase/response regulator [Horticoccus luteus]|uniref:histidine kinase n=1 Tax=Horticoccus luteus TaxID=2862869 RepID=A0A8F9XK27_9BACT|nr:hybrid sensor histidine kinase/response regulator [Horticoccus luteus]QYM77664.1 hybrid sensor histidine kinase/response regulator [Horticoccus luteus]
MQNSAASLPPFAFAGRRILIVDDDRMNLRILGGILKADGYTLIEAATGEQAIELYAAASPDLVLLDVMMPGINGFETCRKLRETYRSDCAPIIFITAKSDSDDVVEGLAAGGVDYLPKPFQAKEVLARIRTHLFNQQLIEEQRNLVEALSRANAAKNRFLGMAAHDLRNPLASIRALAEFLRDGTFGPLNPEQLDLIKTIHEASHSMLDLVNELLDVATIEAGELKVSLAPHDLVEVVGKCVAMENLAAARKKTQIVPQHPAAAMITQMDLPKIKQVVENLLSNAVKYSPPGSTVSVQFYRTADMVGFGVIDQGPGIPDAERDKLFQDFGRLSAQPTGGEKSTGLGLAICRKIVDAHRGSITAANRSGSGCEFRVSLPLSP